MRNGRTLKNVWVLAAAAALAMAVGACSDTETIVNEPEAVWSVVATDDVTVTEVDGKFAIDFHTVALGKKATLAIEVQNVGSAPMTIPFVSALTAPFSTDIPAEGRTVGVAQKVTINVFFSPMEETAFSWPGGEDFGTIAVQGYADQNLSLKLAGIGQAPSFTCDADTLDFGRIVKGGRGTLDLNCTNHSDVDGVLIVLPVEGEDKALFSHPYPETVNEGKVAVAAGETLAIKVTYKADRSGSASAYLEIQNELNDDVPERVARVRLSGFTIDHAIACNPTMLDFGFVAPGTEKHLELVCTNAASAPFQISSILLDASSHQGVFEWLPNEYPIEVPGRVGDEDGRVVIDVAFTPSLQDSGARKNGILVISSTDGSTPRLDVSMTGFAGGPVISCSPAQIDFGVVAKGIPATRTFVCSNTGTDDPSRTDDTLMVSAIETTNPTEFTATPREPFKASGYLIGETFTVDVEYNPADDGVDSAAAVIHSNATNGTPEAPFSVALSGNGRDLPPCEFEIVPAQLRYGIVEKGNSATLEFAVRNHRADAECLIQNLRLAQTCSSAFSLPGGEVLLDVLPPSGELRYALTFSPQAYSSDPFLCDVLFDISNPTTPNQVVPARGASQEPCALIAPNDLDFGTVKPGCATRDREFQIINTCSAPLVLGEIALNEGVSDEFFIRSFPPAGTTIAPGLSQVFTMAYKPEDEGIDLGSVFVYVQGTSEPYLATLRGRAALDATQTDSYEQNDRPKVDLLWVIDNSGSMSEEQTAIASNLRPFLSFAQAQEIDYQIGVTTSGLTGGSSCPGGAGGGEDGRLFPVDNSRPRIITPNTPNMEAVWAANFNVGTCHYDEQEMEAAYRALHPPVIDNCDDPRYPQANDGNCGFLRRDAHLSIIAVTDEVDQSPGTVNFYYNAFLSLKGFRNTHLFNFHAITGDKATGCSRSGTGNAEAGDKLIALVEKTDGGVFQSICSPDWEVSLREMSAAAFGFKTCFFLGNQPEDTNGNGMILDTEGEIQVRMNGRVTPAKGDQGQQIWSYSQDQIAVCFNPLAVPEPGTQLDISYRVACLSW